MQKKKETNKENSWGTQSQISFALFASEISSLRSLDSEWVRTQSLLKNNVSRDFLLLYAIAVTQASLRPALAYKSLFNFVE
jgi:hypothetical protein